MTIQMTETQAMTELIGKAVEMKRQTQAGTETIIGAIVTPLEIEEIEGQEVITALSIEGMITTIKIAGIPSLIEVEESVRIEMLPTTAVTIL